MMLDAARWRADPAAFIEEVLVNPEDDRPFVLTPQQKLFLRHAFELTPDGRLKYPEIIFSAPKKTGKTAFGAMIMLYVVLVLHEGRLPEGYCIANDGDQAKDRVFRAVRLIVEASPLLCGDAHITQKKIVFAHSGATIEALASDYSGAAGSNPTISVFDELWGYTSERFNRLWDELIPPPRRIACRLTVSYAGFSGESELLEGLYKRGLKGEQVAPDLYLQPGLAMYWTHGLHGPLHTDEWREQARLAHRPNAYLRHIENRWVTSEDSFIETAWWDECCTGAPVVAQPGLAVYVGVDASTKRDSTAIAVCSWDPAAQKVRLVAHKVYQPTLESPLDFEKTIVAYLLELRQRFTVVQVRFDPFQMHSPAAYLRQNGLTMWEFPQTPQNLTDSSSNLFELIKGRNIIAYPDDEIRLAMQRAVAVESGRGWRITKELASHKIDVVVAIATAALFAAKSAQHAPGPGGFPSPIIVTAGDRFAAVGGRTKLDFTRDW
jgi:phage terminase large subunit-like protein